MTLRLADLEAPLDDVEFPNGTKHQPVPFGPTEYRIWREAQTEKDSTKQDAAMLQILRACYPTATDEDFNTCTVRMFAAMIAHAMRRITVAQDALKNDGGDEAGGAAAAAPIIPPSSPKPSGSTSSRSTRKRSGKTRGASTTASPTDGQSSSGTGSTTSTSLAESTPYAMNWKTSTERPLPGSA